MDFYIFLFYLLFIQWCLNFGSPWTVARQASLSFTITWSLLKLMFIESMMPSSHLVLCHPLFLWPSIFPTIRVFSSESALRIKWPKYWRFSLSISPSTWCVKVAPVPSVMRTQGYQPQAVAWAVVLSIWRTKPKL